MDTEDRAAPGSIIAAVAAGTVPVPFLVVYAGLFLTKGFIVTGERPDITSSHAGEGLSGLVALGFLVIICFGLARMLSGRDRWLFLLGQVIVLAAACRFLFDPTSGGRSVSVVLALGAVVAIGLAWMPPSRRWLGSPSAGAHAPEGLHRQRTECT